MRCLIVDDSAVFLHAVCHLLEHQGIRVVGAASTSEEASRRFTELRPDVTLVDVELGDESGFDVAEQLHAIEPSAPLILVSTHGAEHFAEMIDESSAVGFISKTGLTVDAVLDLLGNSPQRSDGDRR